MRPPRDLVLAVVGWVAVVAVGAGLVWFVVSRAGQGVSQEPDALPAAGRTVTEAPTLRPSPTEGSTEGSTTGPTTRGSEPEQSAPAVPRTWQGAAGVVSVECRGSAIRLTGASPNSGYSVETDHTGPDDVRVEFESGERRTRVEASCSGGRPVFEVDADDD